jgi:hypothetical protein
MRFTPEDYADARTLIAQAFFGGADADGLSANRYQHDHDRELACEEFNEPPPRPTTRDLSYCLETGSLVREYLVLQAGAADADTLRQGFIAWLQRSPSERRQFEEGDDMKRASLVDWFLRVVGEA